MKKFGIILSAAALISASAFTALAGCHGGYGRGPYGSDNRSANTRYNNSRCYNNYSNYNCYDYNDCPAYYNGSDNWCNDYCDYNN